MLVIFGATGDLAARKLFPGLYRLAAAGRLPEDYAVIGSGRHSPGPDEKFHDTVRQAVNDTEDDVDADADALESLLARLTFQTSEADDGAALARWVQEAEQALGEDVRRLVYLLVPPEAMEGMLAMLDREHLTERAALVIEKPFGLDLESSRALQRTICEVTEEESVFRIDHFLGKEAVQNLLALRFGNRLLESAWGREVVAEVQIDVPEALAMEGRGSFYESTGCLRDMISTHLLQLVALVAMEDPGSLADQAFRAARAQALADLRPLDPAHVVFGQYDGYREEDDVADDSTVETLVALKTFVDNDRWRDVPFVLRTGKMMGETRRVITLRLRPPTSGLFADDTSESQLSPTHDLVLELTDDPQFSMTVRAKQAGPSMELDETELDLDVVDDVGGGEPLEAYERLLLDVLHGERALFAGADEVDRLWQVCQPVLDAAPDPRPYEQGSWGPSEALELPASGWRLG